MPASKYKTETPERKDNIPDSVRTPGKDDAAETIDEIIESGKWPMDIKEIAEIAGWSRQHISNTIQAYYEIPGSDENETAVESNGEEIAVPSPKDHDENVVYIDVPRNVDNLEDFLQGYFSGWLDGKEQLDL